MCVCLLACSLVHFPVLRLSRSHPYVTLVSSRKAQRCFDFQFNTCSSACTAMAASRARLTVAHTHFLHSPSYSIHVCHFDDSLPRPLSRTKHGPAHRFFVVISLVHPLSVTPAGMDTKNMTKNNIREHIQMTATTFSPNDSIFTCDGKEFPKLQPSQHTRAHISNSS